MWLSHVDCVCLVTFTGWCVACTDGGSRGTLCWGCPGGIAGAGLAMGSLRLLEEDVPLQDS